VLGYVNTDIVLMADFMGAARRIDAVRRPFLLVGQRWDVEVQEPIDFDDLWEQRLRLRVASEGKLHAITGIDFFVYRRGLWGDVPPFAVGRTIWDRWLVDRARRRGALLIDGTPAITAVHQNHHYASPEGKRGIWTGPEAQKNEDLAGGRGPFFDLIDATHRMTSRGLSSNILRPPIRRRLEVWRELNPRWRWLFGPVVWLVERTYTLRKRLGLAHVGE
jgi:hypothetical protein